MKKAIRNMALLLLIVVGLMVGINKLISALSVAKDRFPEENGHYYKWKYGKVYYTKRGKGSPVLLVHDLEVTSSAYEWNKIVNKLSRKHTVYAIDLLGCGRSEKPNLTYTNYLYVQLINDFIKNIIGSQTSVVATGDSFSFVLMASQIEAERYDKLVGITPTDLYELMKTPSKKKNFLKYAIDIPVLGPFIYNYETSRYHITDTMVNQYFYKPHLVSPSLIDVYHYAGHLGDATGRYLMASIRCNYTNINIVPALKKTNHSICLIGGKEHPFISEVLTDYKDQNPAIEASLIADSCCLPQLENPQKFMELLDIVLG